MTSDTNLGEVISRLAQEAGDEVFVAIRAARSRNDDKVNIAFMGVYRTETAAKIRCEGNSPETLQWQNRKTFNNDQWEATAGTSTHIYKYSVARQDVKSE